MSKEINCLHYNAEGRPVYEKLEPEQLCEIATCPSGSGCDKARHWGPNRPLMDVSVRQGGHEGHPRGGREGHGG